MIYNKKLPVEGEKGCAMDMIVKKVFELPFKDLRNEFLKLALEFNIRAPREIAEQFVFADKIFSYRDENDFKENAPDELLQVSRLTKLLQTMKQIEKLLEEKEELHRIAVFLGSVPYPPGNVRISFMAKSLRSMLPEAIFKSPHRIDEIREQFESMLAAYVSQYLKFHAQINAKLLELKDRSANIIKQLNLLKKLSPIPALSKYCAKDEISRFEFNVKNLLPCEHKPTVEEISQHFVCPRCRRSFMDEGIVSSFLKTAEECDEAFKKCVSSLSYQLSQKVLESEDDALKAIVKAASVSDLKTITNILSDELVERIKEVLA